MTTAHDFPAATTLTETGALPGGVGFVDNGNGTATLSGNPNPGTGGTYTFSIKASNGVAPDAGQSFTLTVDEAPSITSVNQTTFTVGTLGTFTVTTAHDFPAATTLTHSGALPGGISFLDNHNGTATLVGNPNVGTGGTYTFSVTASNGIAPDATQSYALTVDETPRITSLNQTTFTVGTTGTFTVTTAHDFPAATTLTATGALPGGVGFTDNGNGTATLTGNPNPGTGGTYTFSVDASNGISPDGIQTFTLTVNEAPHITSVGSVTYTAGSFGTVTVTTAHDFPSPAALTETGTLPGGVGFRDIGNGTAILAGIPNAGTGGTYTFSIKASNGVAPDDTQSFTLTVDEAPTITSASSTSFTVAIAGKFTITTAHDFPAATTLTRTGALPSGVTFTDNGNGTATLAGTPTAGGSFTVTVTASNGVAPDATQSFTLVAKPPVFVFKPAALTGAKVGVAFSRTVVASGGTNPVRYTYSGSLPPGVSLNPTTGVLSGTPRAPGTFNFTVTAQDSSTGTGPFSAGHAYSLVVAQGDPYTVKFLAEVAVSELTLNSGSFQVLVLDRFGNRINGPVSLSLIQTSNGTNLGTLVTGTSINGVATFTGFTFPTAGTFRVRAKAGTITADSDVFTVLNIDGRHTAGK